MLQRRASGSDQLIQHTVVVPHEPPAPGLTFHPYKTTESGPRLGHLVVHFLRRCPYSSRLDVLPGQRSRTRRVRAGPPHAAPALRPAGGVRCPSALARRPPAARSPARSAPSGARRRDHAAGAGHCVVCRLMRCTGFPPKPRKMHTPCPSRCGRGRVVAPRSTGRTPTSRAPALQGCGSARNALARVVPNARTARPAS